MMGKPLKVLFLCTGNSVRSQMAEGFARYYGKGKVVAKSAGLEPKGLNPRAVQVMKEIGVDISMQRSKPISEDLIAETDIIITLCEDADERCPAPPARVEKIHWPIPDPAKAKGTEDEFLKAFRKIRDEIRERILSFLKGKNIAVKHELF